MARVLIVEDSDLMRNILRDKTKEAGHEVVGEIADGSQVEKAIIQNKPQIILLDIILPGIIGLDLLSVIQSNFPDIKVIVISQLEDQRIIQEALERGAVEFITKPVDNKLDHLLGKLAVL